jgi:hypothetical protein
MSSALGKFVEISHLGGGPILLASELFVLLVVDDQFPELESGEGTLSGGDVTVVFEGTVKLSGSLCINLILKVEFLSI